MKIQEITEKCKNLRIYEKRCIEDEYAELVIFGEDFDHWSRILEDFLGSATKPAGVKPSKNQKEITDRLGGIFRNQILFQKDYDDFIVLAMFWPWENGEYVTLKMAVISA